MKVRISHQQLAAAVAHASQALPARPPMPVLAGLRVTAADDGLAITGYDYDVSANATVDATVAARGSALVSGRLLSDITRTLRGDITMTTTTTHLVLESGRSRFTLAQLPLGEYPSLPDVPPIAGTVAADAFATAVAQVAPAAGRDDTLPVLTGVQLTSTPDTITFSATDRYRFAVRTLPWTGVADRSPLTTLQPARALAAATKTFASGDLTIGISDGLFSLTGPQRHTTIRALDGQLPAYKSLFPAEDAFAYDATVTTADLQAAVKRVALVAERNTPVRLDIADDRITIHAGTADDATAHETLDATTTGAPVTVAFNPTFLADGLAAIGAQQTRIRLTLPTKPAILRAADADDHALTYLLMPVRLNS